MAKSFTFHQALFGYDAGHNLLASSLSMPLEAKHMLSVATDLSGSPPMEGFDISYTGLPLSGTDYYAFFCTWLAPEMPRPGCVWSHVLLIQLADFAELKALGGIRQLFKRPTSLDWNLYETPITFYPKDISVPPISESAAVELLAALYISSERSVVLIANSSSQFDNLVFEVWSQQWPRLRRNFRFSTGSFADRGRIGPLFDLQITSGMHRRIWQNDSKHLLLEGSWISSSTTPKAMSVWMPSAVNDLIFPNLENFRSFLFDNGADFEELRGLFKKLASAYVGIYANANNDWAAKLFWVAEVFPEPKQAIRLKEHLLEGDQSFNSEEDLKRITEVISFLLSNKESRAFEKVSFNVSMAASFLWDKQREKVLLLLAKIVRKPKTTLSNSFATAVSNAVKPEELKPISEHYPELVPILVSHRPSLAFGVEVWRLPEEAQWQITEVLNKLPLDSQSWGQIMAAKFVTATTVAVRESVDKAGTYAILGIHIWLSSKGANEYLPSQIWREALATPVVDYLQSENSISPESLALCAWIIAPNTIREILNSTRNDVQILAQQPLSNLPKPLRLPTAFLLVTLGLRACGPAGIILIRRGYFEVYEALATSTEMRLNFPWESWILLSSELPQPGTFRDWDRCKRLRKAVRKWIERYPEFKNSILNERNSIERSKIVRETLDADDDQEEFID